jgi:hypothetical protein
VLAKLTSKNQLTLPKSVVEAVESSEYFDVEVRDGQIVLTPVRIQRGDAVRAKLMELGISESDVESAVRSARARGRAPAVAESAAEYRGRESTRQTGRSQAGRKKAGRRV